MTPESDSLRRGLRQLGISNKAITAVWPEWWSAEAELSTSAKAELRYTVARRLGLSPRSLFDGPPRFVWKDDAKFKNLGTTTEIEREAVTSFGVAVGHLMIAATPEASPHSIPSSAAKLRQAILDTSETVSLEDLLSLCWGVGVPVIQLSLMPLERKRMHAMSVRVGDRFALLLGRRSAFAAQAAYDIAHELGHIALHHVSDSVALLEFEDPLTTSGLDTEEGAADSYALELLTGSSSPIISATEEQFTATQLADAAIRTSPGHRIDPGVLALCLGHASGRWRQAVGSLKLIPPGRMNVPGLINSVARQQLQWTEISDDSTAFLSRVMDKPDAA